MQTHHLQLATTPFEAIRSGRKTIESRLYDEKRQAIELGDQLIFTNREDESQHLHTTVVGLLRYQTFTELFTHNDIAKFGGQSVNGLLEQIEAFYSQEQQAEHGVIGIELILDDASKTNTL
jgi:ASC-1-like (ASCH) protein